MFVMSMSFVRIRRMSSRNKTKNKKELQTLKMAKIEYEIVQTWNEEKKRNSKIENEKKNGPIIKQ